MSADCSHDTLERFGSTNGVYECADCDMVISISEFRRVRPPLTGVSDA